MSGTANPGGRISSTLVGMPGWNAMSLLNSWVNMGGGWVTAQYRKWALINEVEVIGAIKSGTLTDGTVIATLATLTPVSEQHVCSLLIFAGSISAPTLSPRLYVDTSGDLTIGGLPSGTTEIGFHGWYSLDA